MTPLVRGMDPVVNSETARHLELHSGGERRSSLRPRSLTEVTDAFFDHPILNSPYEYPARHWELDDAGPADPADHRDAPPGRVHHADPEAEEAQGKAAQQDELVFDEGKGLSTEEQQYDPTSIINEVRQQVDHWRALPNPSQWRVTPETARLLQHWRHHEFSDIRPFFCQVEAVETAIWLTEVAPHIDGRQAAPRPPGRRQPGRQPGARRGSR